MNAFERKIRPERPYEGDITNNTMNNRDEDQYKLDRQKGKVKNK